MKGSLETSVYHSVLRIAVCVFAVALVFDSGLLSKSTSLISSEAQRYVATAIGVRVGVAPNEVNLLTKRITELEGELDRKNREIAVNLNTTEAGGNVFSSSTFILSAILFILLLLIILNYVMDYLRYKPFESQKRVKV